jgi:hypothetical protein
MNLVSYNGRSPAHLREEWTSASASFRAAWLAGGLALLGGCATVEPGYEAVVTNPLSGVKEQPLTEGVSLVNPLAQVDHFDLRTQERNENLLAVAADGASVEANASVVTYHIVPGELVAFDRHVGQDAYPRVIRPLIQAAVQRVVAGYTALECQDRANIPAIESAITALASRELRPFHVQLERVLMRNLTVSSRAFYQQVVETSQSEQLVLTMPNELQITRMQAEALRLRARAIAKANAIVDPTLTPKTLAEQSAQAWTAILTSPSTAVDVVTRHSRVEVEP